MATGCLTRQSAGVRGRGLGWRAERCTSPERCELHLCIADDRGGFWHPDDPLAFAQWRIRADLGSIPAHVKVSRGAAPRAVLGGIDPGGTPAVLGVS